MDFVDRKLPLGRQNRQKKKKQRHLRVGKVVVEPLFPIQPLIPRRMGRFNLFTLRKKPL